MNEEECQYVHQLEQTVNELKSRNAWLEAQPARSAPPDEWLPIETAPKDGILILLLIEPDREEWDPLEDSTGPTPSIGSNHFDHNGTDEWSFAGWCWSHDHFTHGHGKPVKWKPFPPYEGIPA